MQSPRDRDASLHIKPKHSDLAVETSAPVRLPSAVLCFLAVSLCLYFMWAAFDLFRELIQHNHDLHMSPFYGLTHLYDLNCFRLRFDYFHSPGFFFTYPAAETFMYPPLMAVLYKFFYLFHFHSNRWFYGLTEAPLCLMVVLLARTLRQKGLSPYRIGLLLGCTLLLSLSLPPENVSHSELL